MADRFYRGQGKLYLSDRDPSTGQPTDGFRWLGNVPMLKISTQTEEVSHTESYTGQQLEDLVIETTKRATLMLTLEDFSKENLALALFGQASTVAGATVTAETKTAYVGKSFPLNKANLTSFTSLTNSGGNTTYANGTDYTVNLQSGMVTIPSGSAIPDASTVKANYTAGAVTQVSTYTAANKTYWLFFEGLNTADTLKPVLIDIFKVRFKPLKEWDLINNDNNLAKIDLDGKILYDPLQPDNTTDGRFLRIRYV